MKFRNATDDTLEIPALGIAVDPGQTTPDLSDDEAAGFIGQAEAWAAVGADAKAVQKDAVAEQAPTEAAPAANEGAV